MSEWEDTVREKDTPGAPVTAMTGTLLYEPVVNSSFEEMT